MARRLCRQVSKATLVKQRWPKALTHDALIITKKLATLDTWSATIWLFNTAHLDCGLHLWIHWLLARLAHTSTREEVNVCLVQPRGTLWLP